MDIAYLLFLQNLRNGLLAWFSPIADWASKFVVSIWPLAIGCIIYWVFDRQGGKRILAGFGLGMLANGFLKLVFCVYRPWIRDARVVPYGDAITAATGYSFPSGHSTWATGLLGGSGWWARRWNRLVAGILIFLMALVLFSRNFLGVHTPQDVLVGFASTVVMMILVNLLENWTDRKPARDKYVMIGGLLLCVALVAFYFLKSYPLTYQEDGSLLVDPAKMRADSFEGIGFISSYVICRYFERRHFQFDTLLSWKDRCIVAVVALLPLTWWTQHCVSMFEQLVSRDFGKFMQFSVTVFYVMIVVPFVMSRIRLPEKLQQRKAAEAEQAEPTEQAKSV